MACRCKGPMGHISDLPSVSLMPNYVPAAGFGDDAAPPAAVMTTTQRTVATLGWIAVGGVCGAALFVAGKEFLKS